MITENRWLHILGVARQTKRLAEKMRPNDVLFAEDMFLLGMLHDFGYEFTENGKGHAAADAEILKRQGYKNWKIIAEHGNPEIKEMSDALFILNCADMTVSAEGKKLHEGRTYCRYSRTVRKQFPGIYKSGHGSRTAARRLPLSPYQHRLTNVF